ncbi:hypothetical protein [Paraburkholderia sp. A3RO-2L]|jgi:hypothetical protein|uniref:hypothetical protein n=1 Tax=unclassified Paraburkholderia TaxID=2615204 RepID=UPI003DA84693
MTTIKAKALENADAHLHVAGLPTCTQLLNALSGLLDVSGNVHDSTCALFGEARKPCDCPLGVARSVVLKYREAA